MREWVRIAYHLGGGMSYDRYRQLSLFERQNALDEYNLITANGRELDDPRAWK